MIGHAIIALGSVGFFVILAEIIANRNPRLSREITRKIAHIGIALVIALWPLYLGRGEIIGLGVIITLGVLLSVRFGLTSSIHSVTRKNYGELMFGLAVIVAAAIAPTLAIFSTAILFLGLADGLAAISGTLWGRTTSYKVLGDTKSVVGTMSFFFASVCILFGYHLLVAPLPFFIALGIALGATLLENISIRGFDNLSVTLIVIGLLSITL